MRIERETLRALRASGRAAASLWSDGGACQAVDAIAAATRAPELQSPGTGAISPQAATHLGHAIGEALLEPPASSRSALRLAAALLASPNPSQRMIGPHLLTPLARESPECSGEILRLADLCTDAAAAAALAIPLAAAVSREPARGPRPLWEVLTTRLEGGWRCRPPARHCSPGSRSWRGNFSHGAGCRSPRACRA